YDRRIRWWRGCPAGHTCPVRRGPSPSGPARLGGHIGTCARGAKRRPQPARRSFCLAFTRGTSCPARAIADTPAGDTAADIGADTRLLILRLILGRLDVLRTQLLALARPG